MTNISEHMIDKPYKYNMSRFYRIILPIVAVLLFVFFIYVLFNITLVSPGHSLATQMGGKIYSRK